MLICITGFIYGNRENDVYVNVNETVTLSCGLNVTAWWGPSNLTAYVTAGKLDPTLPNYKRLKFSYNHIADISELQIREFSKKDEGLFRCVFMKNGTYTTIQNTVLIKSK